MARKPEAYATFCLCGKNMVRHLQAPPRASCHSERSEEPHKRSFGQTVLPSVISQPMRGPSPSSRLGMTARYLCDAFPLRHKHGETFARAAGFDEFAHR